MRKYLICSGCAIALFIVGLSVHRAFIDTSLSILQFENVLLSTSGMSQVIKTRIHFAFVLAAIPILVLISQLYLRKNSIKRSLLTTMSILLGGFIAWQLRIQFIQQAIKDLTDDTLNYNFDGVSMITFSSLMFELYLFVGFVSGAFLVVSILAWKQKWQQIKAA